jgi:hypothetical protein
MLYDPTGTGAAPDDFLVRRGKSRESCKRLAKQAGLAEAAGFGYGVSVTSPDANRTLANDPADAVQATCQALEDAGFEVCYTPTNNDADHHTVLLPKPLAEDDAEKFNAVFERTR